MPRTTTTTTTSKSLATIVAVNKPPSTICGGFIDVHGIWNNGFACPIQNSVQYFCCGTDYYHYCCTPNQYISDINTSTDLIYISGQYQPSNHIIMDESNRLSLIKNSNIINKQFEEFQRVFLPIFLLTSSVLFLIGIAIWFWLYKHKTFYATESNEQNSTIRRRSQSINNNNTETKQRDSINLTMNRHSRRLSCPSTEV